MNLECPHCGQRVNAEFVGKKIMSCNGTTAIINEKWKLAPHGNKLGLVCIRGIDEMVMSEESAETLKRTNPRKITLNEYLEALGV